MFSLNESNRFVLSLNAVSMRYGINGLEGVIRYAGLNPLNEDVCKHLHSTIFPQKQ